MTSQGANVSVETSARHGAASRPAATEERPFQGKVVLITGSSDGIGAATARLLSAAGASVVVNYHDDDAKAGALVEALNAAGGQAVAVRADVTEHDQVQALVAETAARLGPVDVMVANASGLYGHDVPLQPFLDTSWAHVDRVVRRRLQAFVHPVRAVLPGMLERRRGAIVVVGSSLSKTPAAAMLPISMAQAAVEAGVKSLAREVSPHGVRVNAVAPNFILTAATSWAPEALKEQIAERAAVRRNGLPEDVAEAVAFLASDRSSYLTGSYLVVDGGTAMP
jgi:3-oxoacyl-[acyl-carrier protein] reductase